MYLDPGMWVTAPGSPLQLDVQRAGYTRPVTITQIIYPPSGGTVRRPLPASVINGFNYGLTRFLTLTARNSAGKVAARETIPFCPDSYDPERTGPSSPRTSPYPQQCPTDPFALSAVWVVQRGWARAGTMGFDGKKGHDHWHFEQFARYALVTPAKTVVVRSHKWASASPPRTRGTCWRRTRSGQPASVGLQGACGSPTALWVTEELPVGWGDTYIQSIAGQNFDLTAVPNGTYYIEVAANPEEILHETTASNDVSFRKIILGGAPGHRTVKVPSWHGLDPEP